MPPARKRRAPAPSSSEESSEAAAAPVAASTPAKPKAARATKKVRSSSHGKELSVEQIRSLEASAQGSQGSARQALPSLLAAAALQGDSPELLQSIVASSQALRRLFSTWAEEVPACRGSGRKLLKTLAGAKDKEFALWVVERRAEFIRSCLMALLELENEVALQSTLACLLDLVLLEGGRLEVGDTEATASLWHRLVAALLLRSQPLEGEVWREFFGKYALRYGDLALAMSASLGQLCSMVEQPARWAHLPRLLAADLPASQVCGREIFTRALFKAILLLSQVSRQQPASAPVFQGPCAELWTRASAASKGASGSEPKVLAARISDTWMAFLQVRELSAPTCLAVLQYMKTVILPCLARPIVVADFLVEAYNLSGLVALLALDGLFHLIHQHNLDFPDFYGKLYSLLAPPKVGASSGSEAVVANNLFLQVEHRNRLYELLPVFLASAYLPQNFVASFVKRLARLAVTVAPPDFAVFALMLCFKLLKRHPALRTLVHRSGAGGKRARAEAATESFFRLLAPKQQESDALLLGAEDGETAEEAESPEDKGRPQPAEPEAKLKPENPERPGADPYDPDQEDLARTGALQSSLWELKALEKHYLPLVARQAKLFFDGFGVNKPGSHLSREQLRAEMLVQEAMEKNVQECPLSYDGLFEAELRWRKNQRMPMALEESHHGGLFPSSASDPVLAMEDAPALPSEAFAVSFTPRCFSGTFFSVDLRV